MKKCIKASRRYVKASLVNSNLEVIKKNLMIYETMLQQASDKFFREFDEVPEGDSDGYDYLRARFYQKYLPLAQKCEEIVDDFEDAKPYSIPGAIMQKKMYRLASEIVYNFPYEWKVYMRYLDQVPA